MPDVNLNAWWCRHLLQLLHARGLAGALLCPGNRDLPLLAACLQHAGLPTWNHPDERGAGFAALGWALALQAPVAVVCTSGSALANLLPALCEADAAGIALIVMSADRPSRLQGCGAPQTMPQAGTLGAYALSCALPDPSPIALASALIQVEAALSQQRQQRRALHINIPLDDPLPPLADQTGPLADLPLPPSTVIPREPYPAHGRHGAQRPLVIVGPEADVPLGTLATWLREQNIPVLADAPSGLWDQGIPCLGGAGAALGHISPPDILLRIGGTPVESSTQRWCAAFSGPVLRFSRRSRDWLHPQAPALNPASLTSLQLSTSHRWRQAWQRALRAAYPPRPAAWDAAGIIQCVLNHNPGWLHVANSLSVRLVNQARPPSQGLGRVSANRGVNGIDGTIATAAGIARARASSGTVILGDLACLHDLPSLTLLRNSTPLRLIVIDNGGGRIFDQLPVAHFPELLAAVRCPCPIDIALAARACSLAGKTVRSRSGLLRALRQKLEQTTVLHCLVDH